MHPNYFRLACFFAALAVGLGAFGAHGLEGKLSPDQLASYETAVRYQFYHTFALMIVGIFWKHLHPSRANWAGMLFAFGIVLFSGSIYLLSTGHLLGIDHWRWLGPITPLGGLAFISGWLLLAGSVSPVSGDK